MCLQYSFGKLSLSCIRFELLFLDHSKDNSSDVFSLSLRLRIDSSYMQFSRYILIQETFLKSAGLSDLSSSSDSVGLSHPVGLSGLEPPTSRLSGVRSNQLSYKPILKSFDFSGDEEIRTLDPLLARQVLSQLSYIPIQSGSHLLSHTVSSAVPSAGQVLTVVFGMGTGVSPVRIATRNLSVFSSS